MNNQKDLTDSRLREVNAELKSLKTLIAQRMNPTATSTSVNNYLRPSSGNATPSTPAATPVVENAETNGTKAATVADETKRSDYQDYVSGLNPRSSPFSSGMQAKASIPAWQMMASKSAGGSSSSSAKAATVTDGDATGTNGTDAQEAAASSS